MHVAYNKKWKLSYKLKVFSSNFIISSDSQPARNSILQIFARNITSGLFPKYLYWAVSTVPLNHTQFHCLVWQREVHIMEFGNSTSQQRIYTTPRWKCSSYMHKAILIQNQKTSIYSCEYKRVCKSEKTFNFSVLMKLTLLRTFNYSSLLSCIKENHFKQFRKSLFSTAIQCICSVSVCRWHQTHFVSSSPKLTGFQ